MKDQKEGRHHQDCSKSLGCDTHTWSVAVEDNKVSLHKDITENTNANTVVALKTTEAS